MIQIHLIHLSCAKYVYMKIMQVNICWYESFKIRCRLLPLQWTQSSIFIVLSPFQGLLSLWSVPLIESTANPHLQFDISCSCPINPMRLSLIPCIDLTYPLPAELQWWELVCVYILDVDILYLWSGGGSCWAGRLWVWLRSQGRLHSRNQPPPSSTSIHTF